MPSGRITAPCGQIHMQYVVAYDIANPQRLRRIARVMERRATRCQKSVFIFRGNAVGLQALLDEVAPLLEWDDDIVQAWKISSARMPSRRPTVQRVISLTSAGQSRTVGLAKKQAGRAAMPGPLESG